MPENARWSFLGADMHSHFIPGIDDGAKTMDDSLAMIRAMADMGFKTIITTPHIMIDHYPNTAERILQGLQEVQDAVKQNNIDATVRAAAEYYIDDHFEKLLDTGPLLTIRDREVLVEFSMMFEPPMLAQILFKMIAKGYRPVIAHPERYLFFHRDMDKYTELKDRGCLMQMNMLSITGHYGGGVKHVAEKLLEDKIYDYCGSDMHHEKHAAMLSMMTTTRDYFKIADYPFLNSRLSL